MDINEKDLPAKVRSDPVCVGAEFLNAIDAVAGAHHNDGISVDDAEHNKTGGLPSTGQLYGGHARRNSVES